VAKDSITPTFATAVLHINNARWKGVPFILKCGKALNERKAEIRIQFSSPCSGLFPAAPEEAKALGVGQTASGLTSLIHNNELVIRIQPNEAVYLKLMSKMPGLEFAPVETELSLSYKSRYPTRPPPEAYARLILDVLRGDQSQFVRNDELAAAWDIFTPVLHRMEREKVRPLPYPFGSRGPIRSDKLST
jgi:glucose-6-phosphate 1-dehydrogenase